MLTVNNYLQRLVILCLIILMVESTNAQPPDFNFITFSSKDGLSSNAVNSILKDRYGYMWFATADGLNKFDGENFTVYRHNAADSTSVPSNNIVSLCEDANGNLWVGTSESLCLYDRRRDAFINYNFIACGFVRALCLDESGNLWIGSYLGLFVLNTRTGKVNHYSAKPGTVNQLISNTVISIFEDSRKRVWIGTNEGLHLYLGNNKGFQRYLHSDTDPLSITDNSVRSIAEDADRNLWFGTNDGGLSQLLPNGKGFKNYRSIAGDINSLSNNRVYALASDRAGKLWVGTESGLNILDPRSGKTSRIGNDARNKYGLVSTSIRSIYIDKNGVYWIGTLMGGVSKYDKNLVFFNLRQSNAFDRDGLSAPIITSFVEDAEGDIYVGTDGGGLNHYHRKTGLFCHPKLIDDPVNKLLKILAMERVENELWIGTYGQGIYILNTKSGSVKHYTKGKGDKNLLSNDIFCLKKDRDGNVWIGTNGDGVSLFNRKTSTLHHFAKYPAPGDDKLPSNGFIRSIQEDPLGNIWIASNGSGIVVYRPVYKDFKELKRENSNLPSNHVSDVYVDQKGVIWTGTLGGGLSRFDNHNQKFVSYSEDDGLSNAVIYKILESDSGKLWVSTNKGISSFDVKNGKFKNYSSQNGLQKSTFCIGAGLKTASGELFFGGLDGFNFFNPQTFRPNRVVPALVFTDLKIANRSVMPGAGEPIKEHISVAKEITLGYRQSFSLDFVALNYTAPGENRYSYKLEGFDKDWNNVETSRKAVYTNLDPGHYTFRLKATSDDGAWTSNETSIRIYVKPPFWRTTYAYAVYVLLIAGFLVAWRYWGIRKIKRKFALEQERMQTKQMIEQERKEAQRQHEFDELKIKFLTNLSHEFRTPISLIVGPVEKLLIQEGNEAKLKDLTMVKRNANRLLNLVNQLLDFRKLEANELKLHLTDGNLVSFIKDISETFMDMSESKGIRFSFSSSLDHLYTSFDREKLERILFNLLSNAFKFTDKNGEIYLKIERGPGSTVKIIVADTGVGIEPEVKEKIFDRFFQGNSKESVLNQGSGIGLSITKEFVRLHGGSIHVDSTPGNGSVFTILLPCPQKAIIYEPAEQQLPGKASALPDGVKQDVAATPEQEKLTVLLVEDNEDFRSYLRENLERYYKIAEASNGKEGWQKVLSTHPQVVVSDISMPYMDGIALCQKMKSDKRTSHIPVILLTALTGETNHLVGLRTGAVDYLTKPFNFEILNVKIRNLLGLNQHLKDTYTRYIKIETPPLEMQSEDEKLMLSVAKYIEDNIDNPDLSVEELSRHVCMSRGSLYNKILTLTGETPVEFIRSVRLNKAAALLESSNMKISQIGYEVGFTAPNYFARAFKAKFNMAPSEYIHLKRKGS
jgi:signal transduction histidine kinase/ligand-binding sensor domain-containing protein/DNA-binding response OmpR family regulator